MPSPPRRLRRAVIYLPRRAGSLSAMERCVRHCDLERLDLTSIVWELPDDLGYWTEALAAAGDGWVVVEQRADIPAAALRDPEPWEDRVQIVNEWRRRPADAVADRLLDGGITPTTTGRVIRILRAAGYLDRPDGRDT